MTRDEFIARVELHSKQFNIIVEPKGITEADWNIIDKVYTWHPSITNTRGKDQIALIFVAGGMEAIKGMYDIADMASVIAEELEEARAKFQAKQREFEEYCCKHQFSNELA